MKKLLLLAFAAFAFAACSDDIYYECDCPEPTPPCDCSGSYTVDFEAAVLGDDGYIWGKPLSVTLTEDDSEALFFGSGSKYFFAPIYTEGDAAFQSLYTDYLGLYGSAFDTWNGFVISNQTDMETSGFVNDKSVYAQSGANESENFAVAYYGKWTGNPYGMPTIHFVGSVKPESVAIANTTYLYLYFKAAEYSAAVTDVTAVITGYNNGIEAGKVEVKLADAATETVKSGWENVDLTTLGLVTSMTFVVATDDAMCPMYMAIDDLVYSK